MSELIWRDSESGASIAVVGDVYRILATGDDTDGKYALWHAVVPPGGGPPPHIHSREQESFYVLEGEIAFYLGDERRVAAAGTFVAVPIGTLHSLKNESSELASMLISVSPAGLERMFMECGVAIAHGSKTAPPPTHDDIEKLLAIAPKYGVEIRLPK